MRVLVIPDLHAPCIAGSNCDCCGNALDFVRSVQDYWQTTKTVFLGDLVDHHRISKHESEPDSKGALDEYEESLEQLRPWYQHFRKATMLTGNHDALVHRQAASAGLPAKYIRTLKDFLELPKGWDVVERWGHHELDNVLYFHGDCGPGGQGIPAYRHAMLHFKSVVQGHYHQSCGIQHFQNSSGGRLWGMQAGALACSRHLQMRYGRKFSRSPIMACAVVIDGEPFVEVMPS